KKSCSAKTVMVANPSKNLKFSEFECAWIRSVLDEKQLLFLSAQDALPVTVLETVGEAETLHISTHAHFDLNRPLSSFLVLSNGLRLTLKELLPVLNKGAPDLVVLSACETGRTRVTSTPDEFLGFPSAFLHMGTRNVLSTLWPVDDAASSFLIGFFYLALIKERKSPAAALQSAQQKIRRLSYREYLTLLRDLKHKPPPLGPIAASRRTELRTKEPSEDPPFADPWFWAAFTLSG
ncbi:MAG: CHAT domain-containing protein, partial [Candidatus Omnitrophica bacterium]|nr:CHAT domain-containing protein [Candidatus Omnitrophota bacterium]